MTYAKMLLPVGVIVRDPHGDHYVVEAVLGTGENGAVYLVRQKVGTQAYFALKESITPTQQEREHFLFEGQLLQHLHHPALPRVYRIFEHESLKRSYLLMDYVRGKNLDLLRQEQSDQRLPLPLVLTLLAPIADALMYLHQQKPPILHRDIKPSNIIVPVGADAAVLVDFGTAKPFIAGTATVLFRGSSRYAAPEQYTGGTSPQTDTYGLAATLYTLLTGSTPPSAVSRVMNPEHDPLKPVIQITPIVPAAVSHAIERALSLKSEDRFATLEAFWHEITTQAVPPSEYPPFLLSTTSSAHSEQKRADVIPSSKSNRPPAPRSWRRSLFLLVALALLLILLLGVMIVLQAGILHF